MSGGGSLLINASKIIKYHAYLVGIRSSLVVTDALPDLFLSSSFRTSLLKAPKVWARMCK